jgi:hypothetical protein
MAIYTNDGIEEKREPGYTKDDSSLEGAGDPYKAQRDGHVVDADRLSQLSELGQIERGTTHRGLKGRQIS